MYEGLSLCEWWQSMTKAWGGSHHSHAGSNLQNLGSYRILSWTLSKREHTPQYCILPAVDTGRSWCEGDERHVKFPVGSGRVRAPTVFYAASWIAAGSPDTACVRPYALELDFAGSNPGSVAD